MRSARIFLIVSLWWLASLPCGAAPWAIVANHNDCTVSTVDLGTVPPTVYGPFLSGSLGTPGPDDMFDKLYDVAVTPDGRYALISSFRGQILYRVDVSNPMNPSIAGALNLGVMPIGIVISPNGQIALVTGGNSSEFIAFIDLATFSLNGVYYIQSAQRRVGSVAIAADNQTVIAASSYGNYIVFGTVNSTFDGLTSESTLPTSGSSMFPNKVVIAPDGQTALVNFTPGASGGVSAFKITGPGAVVASATPTLGAAYPTGLAFAPNSAKAYVDSVGTLSWLQVNGPDNITVGAGTATLVSGASGHWVGVHYLAVTPDGQYLVAGNPTDGGSPTRNLSLVDLSDLSVTSIPTDTDVPAGIAVFLEAPAAGLFADDFDSGGTGAWSATEPML